MNTPLVSVVIPVYNTEKYIESCILSVIGQTYLNLEIIIVNDGSTDRSASIIATFASLEERIVSIDKPNEGPALTRKKGVEVATGKYIQFLDSDDTLLPDAIELLVGKAEDTNADIVAFPFFFCDSATSKYASVDLCFSELHGVEYFKEIIHSRANWSLWSHFQKRSLFYEYSIETISDIFYGEDAIWMTQLLLHNPKVVAIKKPLLNYNRNLSSISFREDISAGRYKSFRAYQVWMENYIEKEGLTEYLKKELALQHLQTTFISIDWRQLADVSEDMKRVARDLRRHPDLKHSLSRRKLKILFFYRVANFVGNYYLMKYIKCGKI